MSEQNKAVARRFYEELMNKKNLNVLDEIVGPTFVDHTPMPGVASGIQGIKQMFSMFLEGFPDLNARVDEQVAEKETVVTRFTVTATHTGELMGAKPTGKRVTMHGVDTWHFKNGKITDVWHYGDEAMVMAQLGIKPPM